VLKKISNFMGNYCKKHCKRHITSLLEIKTVSKSLRGSLSRLLRAAELADHGSPEEFLNLAKRLDLINISAKEAWNLAITFDRRLKDHKFGDVEEYEFFCDFYDPEGHRMDTSTQDKIIYQHHNP
jgi:hypothetical protein